eukprot:gene3154-3947_t
MADKIGFSLDQIITKDRKGGRSISKRIQEKKKNILARKSGGGKKLKNKPILDSPIKITTSNSSTSTTSTSKTTVPPLKITIENNIKKSKASKMRPLLINTSTNGRSRDIFPQSKNNANGPSPSSPLLISTSSVSSSPRIRKTIVGGGGRGRGGRGGRGGARSRSPSISPPRSRSPVKRVYSSHQYDQNIDHDDGYESGHGPSLFDRNNHNSRFRTSSPSSFRPQQQHHHHQPQQHYQHQQHYSSPNQYSSGGMNGIKLHSGSTLKLSNLHHDISEGDINLLMSKIGEVKNVKINYDRTGRSEGTGSVVFVRHKDAMAAKEQFHNVQLDGFPLHITFGPSLQEDIKRL